MQDPFNLGEKARQFRVHENWTQEYVAAQLGVPKTTYCDYEKGLHAMPNALVVKAAALFKAEPEVFFTTAPLKLGTARNDDKSKGAELAPAMLRSFEEREQKLLDFMKAQAEATNEQMAMIARSLRGGLIDRMWFSA
jgi:transcriptional regulator with XRE-family HTH domain